VAHYHAGIHSPVDPPTAFAYLGRFDRATEWDPSVSEGAMLTDEPVARGSRFRLVTRFLGRPLALEYEVIEHEIPTRIVLQAETGAFRSTDTITFRADDAGTLVDYDAVLEPKGLTRLAGPLLDAWFRRVADRAAAGLRTRLREL